MNETLKTTSTDSTLSSKIKELGKHFIIYGLGSAMQGLVTFLLLPLLSNYFSVEEYGIYSLIVLVSTLLGSVFYLGGQSAITRFYFDENTKIYKSRVVTNSSLIMFIGTFLCLLVGIMSSSLVSLIIFDSVSYWKIISVSAGVSALNIINTYLITYLRIIKKSSLFVIVNILNLTINFFLTLIFLKYDLFKDHLLSPFIGQFIGVLVSVLFSGNQVLKKIKLSNIDFSLVKLYLLFSFPIVLKGLIFYVFELSDRFIIENTLTLSDVGIYSFGYKIGTIINLLFVVPFGLVFSILRMEYAKDNTSNEFFSKITTYYTIVGMGIVIVLVVFSKVIISIASSSLEYNDAYTVAPWILIGQMILGYTIIFDFGIYYFKKTYFYLVFYSIGLSLNISLNLLFLEKYGYEFAAFNKLISYLTIVLVMFYISNKYYSIVLEKRFYKILLFSILLLILIQSINVNDLSIFYSFIALMSYIIFCYKYVFTKSEVNFITTNVKKIIGIGTN